MNKVAAILHSWPVDCPPVYARALEMGAAEVERLTAENERLAAELAEFYRLKEYAKSLGQETYLELHAENVRLRAEISHLKTEIERHSKNSDLQMHRAIRAEDEAKRLRTCLVEAARLLTLEQLQQLSNSSVLALADIGLLVNQQQAVKPETREEKNEREMAEGTRCNGLCKEGLCNC